MMLSEDLYCEMMFKYLNIRIVPYLVNQCLLNGLTGPVLCMQDTVFRMSTLLCQVIGPVFFLIERDSKINKIFYSFRSLLNNKPYNFFIADPVAGDQRIPDMFFKIIGFTEYCSNAALGITRV